MEEGVGRVVLDGEGIGGREVGGEVEVVVGVGEGGRGVVETRSKELDRDI